jgi:hypothetical protein
MHLHPNNMLTVTVTFAVEVEELSLRERSLSILILSFIAETATKFIHLTGTPTRFAYHRTSPKGQAHQQGKGQ